MSTFIGNTQPNNYYIGNTPLSALYVGTNKIWPVGQEIAWFDFANTTSYTPNTYTINNISANKNYVAGNIANYGIYSSYPAATDPSGSGLMMKMSASATSTYNTNYMLPTNGTLFAMTSSNFTFEAWIRPIPKNTVSNVYTNGPDHSAVFSGYNSWQFGFSNVNTNDGSMVVIQNNGLTTLTTIQSASTAPNAIDFNQWNHLVYTFQQNVSSTTFTMYKNGVLQNITKNNFTVKLNNANTNGYISPGHTNALKFGIFDISQFRMYNKVVDAAEVLSLFQATRARYSI
jgi:hypothetical protein